jgi:hypothetical protein
MTEKSLFSICIFPRESWTWDHFVASSPESSIALDGIVQGGPRYDEMLRRANFDHHDGVVREATMSTAMQVFFAIKGGIIGALTPPRQQQINLFINDTDQDTALAVWLFLNHNLFEGTGSIPTVSRLLALTDRLDITGGAFPMNLDDQIVRQHNWIFRPYTDLRKSGRLATATDFILKDNLVAVLARLDKFMMGQAGEVELNTSHEMLHNTPRYSIVNEIGGNEARYHLFSRGMDAFVSLVATRPDGRYVYSIGRRSRFIRFPVRKLYDALNKAEKLENGAGWNGSDIIGGSPRATGSGLHWTTVRDIIDATLTESA